MRICHFCFSLDASQGGAPNGIFEIAKFLTKYGIKNQIVSTGNTEVQLTRNSQNIFNLRSIGVEFNYTTSRFQNNYGLSSFKGLYRTLTQMSKPDLIVLHQIYTFSTLVGYWYAKKNGIPYAVQPHGSLTKYHESDSRLIKTLAKWLLISRILREAEAIIVTCESEKSDLNPVLQLKVCRLPYGATKTVSKESLLSTLPVEVRNLRIIFSGRFDKKKNLPLLIASLPQVLEQYPSLILDIAGSGNATEVKKVQRLVSSLKLESSVQFHGWIDRKKMQELFAFARLLVLPSENENFAIVVAEALSAGLPCVVSRFVGTADIIAKHHAGEVIHDLTPISVANGIMKVLQGDEIKYREAAFEAVEKSLDWSKIALSWKALVTSLAYTQQ